MAGGRFVVYDNIAYRGVDLAHYGAIRSNVVYEGYVAALSGSKGSGKELALPPEAAYKNLIRKHASEPGPVVLDFESLYLTGAPDTAQRRLKKLETFAQWAHEAVPGKAIGFYGVLGNTASRYYPLARQLARHVDAFFPTLYTFDDNRAAWRTKLADDLAEARAVAPGKPVYPYLWPQYHDGTPRSGQFLSADHWSYELDTARRLVPGVVIWSGAGPVTDKGWITATERFMANLPKSGTTAIPSASAAGVTAATSHRTSAPAAEVSLVADPTASPDTDDGSPKVTRLASTGGADLPIVLTAAGLLLAGAVVFALTQRRRRH
ncbi:LPXTG cell wall anchor domain-containing protein [Streptomyces sp. NPDC020883]|uniref:LPXTG cell wall anchor domain-containing protein n=1 Tax=Streptomyces sp. NPDC020883 TaxID=3365099 RepID=UPI003793F280